jgi:hypothetical protein
MPSPLTARWHVRFDALRKETPEPVFRFGRLLPPLVPRVTSDGDIVESAHESPGFAFDSEDRDIAGCGGRTSGRPPSGLYSRG